LRLVTFEKGGTVSVGVKLSDGIARTGYADMLDLVGDGEAGVERAHAAAEAAARSGRLVQPDRLLAPIRPHQLIFHSINFESVVAEMGDTTIPERSGFFSKLPSSVIGPDEPIVKPYPEAQLDWEVELAWVIGKTASKVAIEEALDYVFGYTVVNDVTACDLFERGDMMVAKGIDTFCPMGPELVVTDEIPEPSTLTLATYVNGDRVQFESTSTMLFSVPQIIATLSEMITLSPGNLITSGTPGGLAMNMKPPRWLDPGDEVTVEIDRIGSITNRVVAGW
jgi:2-keto-4-pentenoate hydratase/2-oxohepta-3-ene-1,7-dioic acid hydratase in catechol pathway